MKNHIAIIPARGGSRAIENKNIRNFCGKPLIAWTIEVAKASSKIDRVLVSTDSPEIAEIALFYGAEVPFIRPSEIAQADTPIEPVMRHAYEWVNNKDSYQADSLVLLFPTNPLREVEHINQSIELYDQGNIDCVVSVNESPAHYTPYWTLTKKANGLVSYFNGVDIRRGYARRQDFPSVCYAKNDAVFVLSPENLYEDPMSLFGERQALFLMEHIFDGDINTEEDWELTEMKFRYLQNKQSLK